MADARNYKESKFMTDAIMNASHAAALGALSGDQIANVARSGQLGVGIRMPKLDGATPQVFVPATAVVLNTPRFLDPWPELGDMLRSLMETHAKAITGIDFSYTVETAETPVGHDGQTMKVPLKTTRSGVSPQATFTELTGNPIWNLFRRWMYAIQHPDTNMSALSAYVDKSSDLPAWYMSAFSMSMLFIQGDPSGLPDRIVDAIVVTNMFPTAIGELGIQRQLGTSEIKDRTIEFTGIVQHNANTKLLGKKVAAVLGAHRINQDVALPGMAGSVDPAQAIDTSIRTFGGLEYEIGRHGANDAVGLDANSVAADSQDGGAFASYQYLGTNSASLQEGDATSYNQAQETHTGSNIALNNSAKPNLETN